MLVVFVSVLILIDFLYGNCRSDTSNFIRVLRAEIYWVGIIALLLHFYSYTVIAGCFIALAWHEI